MSRPPAPSSFEQDNPMTPETGAAQAAKPERAGAPLCWPRSGPSRAYAAANVCVLIAAASYATALGVYAPKLSDSAQPATGHVDVARDGANASAASARTLELRVVRNVDTRRACGGADLECGLWNRLVRFAQREAAVAIEAVAYPIADETLAVSLPVDTSVTQLTDLIDMRNATFAVTFHPRSFAAPIPVALTVARSFEAVDVEAALCNVSAVVDIGAEVEVIMPVTVERCVPFVGCAQVPTGAFETSVTTISAAIAVRPGCVNLTGVAHDSRLRSELDGGTAMVREYAQTLSARLRLAASSFLPPSAELDVAWTIGAIGCTLLGLDVCALSEAALLAAYDAQRPALEAQATAQLTAMIDEELGAAVRRRVVRAGGGRGSGGARR